MISDTRRVLEQLDNNDPTLALDGLSDLLPARTALGIDPTLAVDTLGELFPEREADEVEDYFGGADTASMTAAPSEEPVEPPVDDQVSESAETFESGEVFQSDIQRAAAEFERFAGKFHAFASQCQQR